MALLECGADPLTKSRTGCTPLIECAMSGYVDCVARLLEDPRVRAKINKPFKAGASLTALHCACVGSCDGDKLRIIRLLLGAGADSTVATPSGETPLDLVRQRSDANLAVTLQIQESLARCSNSAVIVKARRLVVCGRGIVPMPSYLQRRVRRGEPLPLVALAPPAQPEDREEAHRLQTLLAFVLGMEGGPAGKGMDRRAFCLMMDMLMLPCDSLRPGLDGHDGMQQI